jgi:hypothetical protein
MEMCKSMAAGRNTVQCVPLKTGLPEWRNQGRILFRLLFGRITPTLAEDVGNEIPCESVHFCACYQKFFPNFAAQSKPVLSGTPCIHIQ